MERKLASVRKISEIRPIPNSDFLDLAIVDGWEVVTQKKNNFKSGDLVAFMEIDSLLPLVPQFEWLAPYKVSAKNSVNGEGYRLKTIKLRGTLSQGLVLPVESLFEIIEVDGKKYISIPEQANSEDRNGIDLQDPK